MLAAMRPNPVIRPATLADHPAIIAVLAAAFIDDPALAWIFPDAARRPAGQGQGVGGALLRAGLARAAGQPCYLETATPSNVGLYQAHGFGVRNEWQHGDAPNFWSMWHPGSVTAAAQ